MIIEEKRLKYNTKLLYRYIRKIYVLVPTLRI